LKVNKKSKYNLSDGEEEDFEFHGLGALSERDDFEDEMLPDDDDHDGEALESDINLYVSLSLSPPPPPPPTLCVCVCGNMFALL
jgi:hypothetical protein